MSRDLTPARWAEIEARLARMDGHLDTMSRATLDEASLPPKPQTLPPVGPQRVRLDNARRESSES